MPINRVLMLVIAIAIALSSPLPAVGASPLIDVGVARVDITPPLPIFLAGYGKRSTESAVVAQPLYARAMAIGSDKDAASVLIAADTIGITSAMAEEVAARLHRRAGLERARVAVCSTHDHSAPFLTGVLPGMENKLTPEQRTRAEAYTRSLADALERAAMDALADRKPARLAWSIGKVSFGADRRRLAEPDPADATFDPANRDDDDLPTLRVTRPDGSLRAVLTGYACHCTTDHPDTNTVHGDWAGAAAIDLEARHDGAIAMVVIGCGASVDPKPRGKFELVAQYGKQVADEVDRLLGEPMRPLSASPTAKFETFPLEFDKSPPPKNVSRGGAIGDAGPVDYPVQSWLFGDDLAMVFLGGEVTADYSIRLKRELDRERVWVSAYANAIPCYIVSKRQLAEGGYEVDGSRRFFGRPHRLAPTVEDTIIGTVHRQVGEAYKPRKDQP